MFCLAEYIYVYGTLAVIVIVFSIFYILYKRLVVN